MSTTSAKADSWLTRTYEVRHTSWPYQESDFTRQDSSSDSNFYAAPRFVTHIDDAAIVSLRGYYDVVLPRKGRILDLCSSWISHYPPRVEEAAMKGELRVTGLGMNSAELDANKVLNHGRVILDLNQQPDVAAALREAGLVTGDAQEEAHGLDASTMVVSIDYLTRPVEVLRSLREMTKKGGTVHLTVSNRCFPTKAIARWSMVDEKERLLMVGDFLHFAGWKQIEIVELSNGRVEDAREVDPSGQGVGAGNPLKGFMAFLGMNSRDPLWVVRGVKE